MRTVLAGLAAVLLLACNSTGLTKNRAAGVATAPPAQTALIRAATPQLVGVATPLPPPPDLARITGEVKLRLTELPREYSYGPFAAFQTNETAVVGYDDPNAALKLMNDTGRLGGFVQSLTNSDGPGGAFTIDVWKEANGAKRFFDQFPKPDKSLTYQEIPLPQPLGEQSYAVQYRTNGSTGYTINWRQGRIILGLGMQFFSGKESLKKVIALASLLEQKAQSATQ